MRNPALINGLFPRFYCTSSQHLQWKSVVGLEIHAQINSISKLFSGAGTDFRAASNRSVALFDAAFPGTLPVLNRRCVEAGVITALALSCELNKVSSFVRKHYFYADLPAGYQITQQECPLARNGFLKFMVLRNNKLSERVSYIHQIQLEQDSGRSLHDKTRSLVDLNRAGLPLMELVFKPDLVDGEEAACLVKELCLVLTRLGTCSCKMEEGALRVDANVSLHKEGMPLGVRTEIKNIGSVRAVANAIDYEIKRQNNLLSNGLAVVNETRSWDVESGETVPMRDKEEKQDYRFMPEPNLPPLHLQMDCSEESNSNMVDVNSLKMKVPLSPHQLRQQFQDKYNLSQLLAYRLVNEGELIPLFVDAMEVKRNRNAKALCDLLLNDVLTQINDSEDKKSCFEAERLGEIVDMMNDGRISKSIARKVLEEMCDAGRNQDSVEEILRRNNWLVISDMSTIEAFCRSVLEENEELVRKHRAGKKDRRKALCSKVWDKSEGRANMTMVHQWFEENFPYKGK